MSGKHGHSHKPFEGHMHEFEAHIRAVEEDLEYYRAKRFEPRIIYLARRGVIGLVHGVLENIRDHRGIHNPLYTVRFDLSEVSACHDTDYIWVDVHEEWLSALEREDRN